MCHVLWELHRAEVVNGSSSTQQLSVESEAVWRGSPVGK